jgi:hypothetical protein
MMTFMTILRRYFEILAGQCAAGSKKSNHLRGGWL